MKIPLRLRVKVALRGVGKVLIKPKYLFLAVLVALLTLGIILWSLNLELLWYIVAQSPLSINQKISFVFDIYYGIGTNYESIQAMVMVLFSIIFGINIAVMTFVIKNGQLSAAKSKSSIGGLAVAIIGGGCIACGTSIITPIVASLGATATVGLNNTIGLIVNLIGIILIGISLIGLGQRSATLLAQ